MSEIELTGNGEGEPKKTAAPGCSPLSGVPPPKHAQFGQPGGNSPYRGGRPAGPSITKQLREILSLNKDEAAKALAAVFIKEGLSGKFPFANAVLERMDGKVIDHIEGKIELNVHYAIAFDELPTDADARI